MIQSILTRLQRLEAATPGTLLAECVDTNGGTKIMPLAQIDFTQWTFKRIVSGNNPKDLDVYFTNFKKWVSNYEYHGTASAN